MRTSIIHLVAIAFSVNAAAQTFQDQGTWNDFHKMNLGKIVFSSEKIVHNNPDPKLVKTEFKLFDQLKGRIYIPKSLANWCDELEKSGKYAKDEFNYSKFNQRIRLKGVISVDGIEQSDFMMDNLIDPAKKTEWTTWWYGFVSFKDSPYYSATETTPENAFGRTIKNMSPGSHKVKITYYMLSLDMRLQSQVEIATGEFVFNVDSKMKEEWLGIYNEDLAPNESYDVPESSNNTSATSGTSEKPKEPEIRYAEIKITNDLSGDFRYYYNGGQNYINSGGVKTYTCNFGEKFYFQTNGSQGKLFLEVTKEMHGKTFKTSEFR